MYKGHSRIFIPSPILLSLPATSLKRPVAEEASALPASPTRSLILPKVPILPNYKQGRLGAQICCSQKPLFAQPLIRDGTRTRWSWLPFHFHTLLSSTSTSLSVWEIVLFLCEGTKNMPGGAGRVWPACTRRTGCILGQSGSMHDWGW